MLSRQFLLGCFQPSRADHCTVSKRGEARNIRPTLSSAFYTDVSSQLKNNKLDPKNYKTGLKLLHTQEVTQFRNNNSKLLGTCPPDLHSSEEKLDRNTRVRLSQLRSGYSPLLNSFNSRIDRNIEDKCNNCQSHGHTTDHLFNCPNRPTNLTIHSLWEDPVSAADFLDLQSNAASTLPIVNSTHHPPPPPDGTRRRRSWLPSTTDENTQANTIDLPRYNLRQRRR